MSDDERAATRARFLDASIDAAAPALQPRLRVWRGGDAWEAIPPADLALRTCDALFLDHGSEMFAWIGRGMAAAAKEGARAAARSLASTLARGRFPIPRVRIFDEGSSAARYMVSRLAPLHRESVHEQDAVVSTGAVDDAGGAKRDDRRRYHPQRSRVSWVG